MLGRKDMGEVCKMLSVTIRREPPTLVGGGIAVACKINYNLIT